MEQQTYETTTTDSSLLARNAAMSAGDLCVAVRGELAHILAANGGDRRKALPSGLDELVLRNALSRTEADELAGIVDTLFDAPYAADTVQRIRKYYRKLVLDQGASPAALAIASVVNSLVSPNASSNGGPRPLAVSGGDAAFGGLGAVIGAGIGAGFGGPIGAGIGAVVGAAVGVCVERS